MCIYCSTKNYRKIYENHHGPIPKDAEGRTYEIHHIDGDHENNDPSNLKCITIQDHYDIHFSQGDWMACWKMSKRMKISPHAASELARRSAVDRVENGTHPFLGSDNNIKRVKNGTHPFLGSSNNAKRVESGTHNFLDREAAKLRAENRIKNGTHPFLGESSPTQVKWTCEHCGKAGRGKSNYNRAHGDKCKMK
jgi:HNH endonuclease